MADVSITATSVVTVSGDCDFGVAGASITAGQWVYLDSATTTLKLADCDLSAAGATAVGVALNGGATGQPIRYQKNGTITIGGTLVAGKVYVLSATAGGLAPVADLTTNWRTTLLGVATTTAILQINILVTGVAN